MFYWKVNCLIYLNNITFCRKDTYLCREKSSQSEMFFHNDTEQHINPLRTFREKYSQEGIFVKIVLYISRCLNNENELSFSKIYLDCSQFEYENNIFQIVQRYLYTQDI